MGFLLAIGGPRRQPPQEETLYTLTHARPPVKLRPLKLFYMATQKSRRGRRRYETVEERTSTQGQLTRLALWGFSRMYCVIFRRED